MLVRSGPRVSRRCRFVTTSDRSRCRVASTAGSPCTPASEACRWPTCLAPAIALAEDGFRTSPGTRRCRDAPRCRWTEGIVGVACGVVRRGDRHVAGRRANPARDRRRRSGLLLRRRVRRRSHRAWVTDCSCEADLDDGAGRLGHATVRVGLRCRSAHDAAQLPGVPHARWCFAGGPGGTSRRSGRSDVGAPVDRVRQGRRIRPTRSSARVRRWGGVAARHFRRVGPDRSRTGHARVRRRRAPATRRTSARWIDTAWAFR